MHKSGVDVVDRVIGGLAPGLPLVLAGPAGAGRTVLCLQLAAAALAAQNIVAFVSGEPPPLLIRQAQTLGLDLEEPLRSEQLILLELEASAAAGLASAGGKALMRAVLAEHPAIGTVVIDPITALTHELVDESRLRSIARELLEDARHADLVFSVETERPVMDVPVERVLMEICGSYLELSRQSDGTRSLAVRKTRVGAGRSEAVEFSIGDQGAIVEVELRIEPPQVAPTSAAVVTDAVVAATPEGSQRAPSADAAVPLTPAELRSGPAGVLVVVEDASQRSQLSGWLETRYSVAAASDGFQAVTMLMAQRPDIIVLDLAVSRVSGYEVLLGLRRACPELPILVIAHDIGRPGYKLGPMVLGATDVLAKNVSQFELMQRVAFALQLAGPPPEPTTSTCTSPR